MTTKAQERAALEKIKKIVNDLGEDSYVATAFEGCFEMAEENINNDWACSMLQRAEGNANRAAAMQNRAEVAEKEVEALKAKVADLQDELIESEKDYEAAHAAAHEIAEQKDAEIAALKGQLMSKKLYIGLYNHLTDIIDQANERIMAASERLADLADCPNDIAVAGILKSMKAEKNRRDDAQQMLSSLEALEPENI